MPAKRKTPSARRPPPPAPRAAPQPINAQLSRAFYLYLNWLDRRLGETGLDKHLKPGMGPILFSLFEEDGVIMSELVERTQLVASTVTRTLQKMEDAGLVSRLRDERDSRAVRVMLTPLGRSLEPACRRMLHEAEQLLTAGLSPLRQRQLRASLATVIDNLRAAGREQP